MRMTTMEQNQEIEFERQREQEIAQERNLEFLQEYQESVYDEWLSENIKDIQESFIKDNIVEFNNFLEQVIIDETYNIDYWKEVFCREENEEEFYDLCKQEYKDYSDLLQTESSLFKR
jgi:hypothetical protein